MFGARIRSALFIDRENVALPADTIANWLSWLEDGVFDEGRRRRFDVKRVYWNSSAEKHRESYINSGFEVVVCERFAGLSNSADIRMAIDIIEMARDQPRISEYILVTADSDFVPVLQRLDEKGKRTAIVVNENQINVHTTYRQHADILIPRRKLTEATRYVRPPRRRFAFLRRAAKPAVPAKPLETPSAPAPASPVAQPGPVDGIAQALDRMIKVTSLQPNNWTGQKAIIRTWLDLPGFTASGRNPFYGRGSYRAFVAELALKDPRIKVVKQKGGGIAVMYVPSAAEKVAAKDGSNERSRPYAESQSAEQPASVDESPAFPVAPRRAS